MERRSSSTILAYFSKNHSMNYPYLSAWMGISWFGPSPRNWAPLFHYRTSVWFWMSHGSVRDRWSQSRTSQGRRRSGIEMFFFHRIFHDFLWNIPFLMELIVQVFKKLVSINFTLISRKQKSNFVQSSNPKCLVFIAWMVFCPFVMRVFVNKHSYVKVSFTTNCSK